MSCAIGGMIGSVAREASAAMKPTDREPQDQAAGLARLWNLGASSGSGFGATGKKLPSIERPESNLG